MRVGGVTLQFRLGGLRGGRRYLRILLAIDQTIKTLGDRLMNDFIVRPITDDGLVGYDQFDQLMCGTRDGEHISYAPIADVRRKQCIICNRGWELTGPSLSDQFRWKVTDDFVHLSCWVQFQGLVQRQDFYRALVRADLNFRIIKAIPNQYWGNDPVFREQSWYEAELVQHPARIVYGVRKRVTSISVIAESGRALDYWADAEEAFAGEDVAKEFAPGKCLVHSWTLENDRRYIALLARALKLWGNVKETLDGHKKAMG